MKAKFWLWSILLLATSFRWLGPFLPHSTGDSIHYVALAMKLRTSGFDGYNLRGISFQYQSLDQTSTNHLLKILPSNPSDPEGDMIRKLRKEYLSYYDEPFHHIAYGYPLLLAAVHEIFQQSVDQWEVVNCAFKAWDLIRLRPLILAAVQWYWLLPSFLSSLGIVVLTYYTGKQWFGKECGLWAALFMAIHPIDILTSQRIWADDALTLFCLATLYSGRRALENNSLLWAIGSGLLMGIAILIKQSGILFLASMIFVEGIRWWTSHQKRNLTMPVLKSPLVLALGLSVVFVTIHWFITMWGLHGNPFYNPPTDELVQQNPWHQRLEQRPGPLILYTVGLFCLSPCSFFGWLRLKDLQIQWLLCVVLIFSSFFILILEGQEYRYLLPTLPLLTITAGQSIVKFSQPLKTIIMATFVFLQIGWSFYLTYSYGWQNWGDIMTPF